ncbi:MAG: hypothetical protein JRM99_09275 [Nitrososphaerota archaeon]|nr:hypothetical protein [Nitrososphaerota archaeon]
MNVEERPQRWYTRWKYVVPLGLLVIIVIAGLLPVSHGPKSRDQVALDRAVDYFARNYNTTLGLVPETPGGHTYWLYSDNYLVSLALGRYSQGNQSTADFGLVLREALGGYLTTVPPAVAQNQYSALNSTAAYFACSADYTISWSGPGQGSAGNGSAVLRTTANDQSPSCASQNYADLLFLQAVHYHRAGDAALANSTYSQGAADYQGYGIVDLQNNGTALTDLAGNSYQTYKLALYVYATYCLGVQRSATDLAAAQTTLLHMQDNSTGGFYTSYAPSSVSIGSQRLTPTSGVNTETTALAALALELMINPTASC